jgi:hypothetical protein
MWKWLQYWYWQNVAEDLVKYRGYDCDGSLGVIMKRWKLIPGKDFVAIHGSIDGVRHMRIELWGRYILDGASPGVKMTAEWKGAYSGK